MEKICRRSFMKKTTLLWASTFWGESVFRMLINESPYKALAEAVMPDIISVKGKDYFANTIKVVEQLGGMKTFVRKGDRVGLLVNSPFKNFGASVNPDIVLAAVQMCYDAGAKEIYYIKDPHKGYWSRTDLSKKNADLTNSLKYESGDHVKIDIPEGIALMVVGSLNRVSLDAFCCQLLGLQPEKILMIQKASRHDLGEMNLQKLQVKALSV